MQAGAAFPLVHLLFPLTCARLINTSTAAVEACANNVLQLMWCESSVFSLKSCSFGQFMCAYADHRTLRKPPGGGFSGSGVISPAAVAPATGLARTGTRGRHLSSAPQLPASSCLGWVGRQQYTWAPPPPYVQACTAALYAYSVREWMWVWSVWEEENVPTWLNLTLPATLLYFN